MASFKLVVFVIVADVYLGSGLKAPFTKAPSSPVHDAPGSNVTLEWNYDSAELQRIVIRYRKADSYDILVTKDNSGKVVTNRREPASLTSRVTIKDNATFVIRNVTYNDTATYVCEFEFLSGRVVREDEVKLFVKEPAARITPESQLVDRNTTATFTCTSEGIPCSIFNWTRIYSGYERETGDGVKIVSDGYSSILTIDQVDSKYFGQYECKVDPCHPDNNAQQKNVSATANLLTRYCESGDYQRSHKYDKTAKTLILKCPIEGYPQFLVTWLDENNKVLQEGLEVSMEVPSAWLKEDRRFRCSGCGMEFQFTVSEGKVAIRRIGEGYKIAIYVLAPTSGVLLILVIYIGNQKIKSREGQRGLEEPLNKSKGSAGNRVEEANV